MNYFKFPIDLTFDKDKFLADPEIVSIVNNIENFGLPLFNPILMAFLEHWLNGH